MGREFELKFRSNPAQQDALREDFQEFTAISMETTYYDTPERALSRRHITLRRRMENETSVCTVKTPAAKGGRGEWECICPDIHQAIPELCKLGGPAELENWVSGGLEPVCGALFTRLCRTLTLEESTVELALDRGFLFSGSTQIQLCEVEVEHKFGNEEATVRFARALAEKYGLVPEEKSKFRRALELAEEK